MQTDKPSKIINSSISKQQEVMSEEGRHKTAKTPNINLHGFIDLSSDKQKVISEKEKLIFTKLELAFSSTTSKNLVGSQKHKHFINLYKLNKPFLKLQISPLTTNPKEENQPLSDFKKFVGNLIFKENIFVSEENDTRVILYLNEYENKFVIKRSFLYIRKEEKETNTNSKIDFFLQNNYKEFSLMRLFRACPFSISPIEFNVVQIEKFNCIATEILMEYGGIIISKIFPVTDANLAYTLMCQITNALNYLECYKIEHNDIKASNILIDYFFGSPIIKFIDFDIGVNESITMKTNKGMGYKGHTPVYAAPEIINLDLTNNQDLVFNPWKAQVYSLGILMLHMLGFFPSYISWKEVDDLKISEQIYEDFLGLVDSFKKTKEDEFMKKIIRIIEICLIYSSEKRLTANELLNLQSNLNEKTEEYIDQEYFEICKSRAPTRDDIVEKCKTYEKHILKLTKEKNTSDKEVEKLHEEIKKLVENNLVLQHQLEGSNKQLSTIVELKAKSEIDLASSNKVQNQNQTEMKTLFSQILLGYTKLKDNLIVQGKVNISKFPEYKQLIRYIYSLIKDLKKTRDKIIEDQKMLNFDPNQFKINFLRKDSYFENVLWYWNDQDEIKPFGILKYLNNNIFVGNFYDGERVGFGLEWRKEYLFAGEFNENKLGPFGIQYLFTFAGNLEGIEYYIGDFSQEMRIGSGLYANDYSHSRYCGQFKNNQFEGIGISENLHCNYTIYEGEFKNHLPEGKGKAYIKTVETARKQKDGYYEGLFQKGLFKGFGKREYSNGDYYEGEFHSGKREGKGKIVIRDGDYRYYEGEFANDQKEGFGKQEENNGDYYIGTWKKNFKEGKGKLVKANGEIYEGEFENDKAKLKETPSDDKNIK